MKSPSLLVLVSSLVALPALAHEGHGLSGSHWHATDTLGFVGVALLIALALWLSRGDR